MRRFLTTAIALLALLLFMPQAAASTPTENDAVDVTTEVLQPAQAVVVEAVQVEALAVLRGEPCPTARQRPAVPDRVTVAPFTDINAHGYTDIGRLLLDHRWTLRAATGRTAAGIH